MVEKDQLRTVLNEARRTRRVLYKSIRHEWDTNFNTILRLTKVGRLVSRM